MRKWLMAAVAMWWAVGMCAPAGAAASYTITFDDLPTPMEKFWGIVPDGYLGFDWELAEVVKITGYQKEYGNKQAKFPSNPNAAYNGGNDAGSEKISFAANEAFLLTGGYFSTWTENKKMAGYSSQGLTVTGYLDGKAVGSSTFSLTPDFVWQEFTFGPVDLVVFRHQESDNRHWWVMDNLQVSAVPQPTTLILFGSGILILGIFGKKAFSL